MDNTNDLLNDFIESEKIIQSKNMDLEIMDDGLRAEKRSRILDQDEIWTTVSRGTKRLARSNNNEGEPSVRTIPEEVIEVSITSIEKLPKQIGMARILKLENIENVVRVKYINPYKVLLRFSCVSSVDLIINCKSLIEKGWRIQRTLEISMSYGIIRDVDLDLSEEEILENLHSEVQIINIKRLKKRDAYNSAEWVDSEVVRVGFHGASLPPFIYSHGIRVKLDPYVYPVTQCSRCWRFGHTHRMCPSNKLVCPKCGSNHPNCDITRFKCANCAGAHMALARICPMYVKEKRLRELMAEFNCTYKRALTLYVPPSPQPTPNLTQQDFPSTFCTQKDPDIPFTSKETTYAQVVVSKNVPDKTQLNNLNTNKKNSGNNKRNKNKENIDEDLHNCPEMDSNSGGQEEFVSDNSEENKIGFQELLIKLKKVIFARRMSWKEKIYCSGKMIIEWIYSYVVSFISEWPFLNLFTSNG